LGAEQFVTASDSQFTSRPAIGGEAYPPNSASRPVSEEEFVRLLRARSLAAWEVLFERHYHRVYRYALGRLLSREIAEDVAATTFDRALATIDSYSYRGRPALAWIYGIARNVVNETRRSEMRQRATGLLESLLNSRNGHRPSDALPILQVDGSDALVSRMDLERALGRLTKIQREVVLLRYFAGLSAAETGQVMGRPETAVYALQARALAALRRQLT
jgi:RNA polymerase sigma-70 factor, ECF subfamily